ncbi:MAG: M18 family aminopeptidase [Clostridiales bacterium]|nr:M18 family aminopeptidase [Clostridiales bacterium]
MNNAEKLIEFIGNCPEAAFGAKYICKEFDDYGFERLEENRDFKLKRGGAYYVVKNASCVVAFTVGQNIKSPEFKIAAAHLDSPAFRIKKSPTIIDRGYVKLNTESYGGVVPSSWFDRPLSFAGRIIVSDENPLKPTEIYMDFKRPMLTIPSLAPHFGKRKNETDFQKDTLPVCGILGEGKAFDFEKYIAKEARVNSGNILDYDFTVYNCEKGSQTGLEKDFVSAPRLDDLLMVYCIMEGFKKERSREYISMAIFTDHEEVGSLSSEGAKSVFIRDCLKRISGALDFSEEDFYKGTADSIGLSADLSHAYHPNYGEKYDITSFPVLNGGIVLKHAASKSYSTELYAGAAFVDVCRDAGVKVQHFYNRSGIKGGSTIGAALSASLGIPFTDMGLSVLGMHSARELCGSEDIESGVKLFKSFYGL